MQLDVTRLNALPLSEKILLRHGVVGSLPVYWSISSSALRTRSLGPLRAAAEGGIDANRLASAEW